MHRIRRQRSRAARRDNSTKHPPIGSAVEVQGFHLRRRSRVAIDRGSKVGICEAIRNRSPHSGAKFNSDRICRRNSDGRPLVWTCTA